MKHDPRHDEERESRIDAAIASYLEAADAGKPLSRQQFLDAHPGLRPELEDFLADHEQVGRLARPFRALPAGMPLAETAELPRPMAIAGTDLDETPETVGGYRLGRTLGVGGMGRVYEATDATGRKVAVKIIAQKYLDVPSTLERFRQEGKLASKLSHPRCVFVVTADHEAGLPYIVMELMPGTTLKDLVERNGPLAPLDAVAKMLDVVEGLTHAHQHGVIHRDVKPANCYLDADGRVKVGDFGLSRSLEATSELTQSGTFVGTPLFASPEQLRGEKLDQRTDTYSACATLYYLLTGQPPFGHVSGPALIARVVSDPPPSPRLLRPDIPAALEQILEKGLDRHRERRYQSLSELRDALLPLLQVQSGAASLGLRLGAFFLDNVLFYVAGQVGFVMLVGRNTAANLALFLGYHLIVFLYFWLGESIWGCTVGKRLVGMRVVRAQDGERAGPWQCLVRYLVFLATGGFITDLLLYAFVDLEQTWTWLGVSVTGNLAGLALRLAPMRARNGYRMLHEFASGTRVMQFSPSLEGAAGATLERGRFKLPVLPRPAGIPERLGGFQVLGLLAAQGSESFLLAEDRSVQRQAWIWLHSHGDGVAIGRRELVRPGRLRWLGSGLLHERRWDAFVAPVAMPLKEALATFGELPWPVQRRLLETLTEELQAGDLDGSLPKQPGLDLVWLQPGGHVLLLDGWPSEGSARAGWTWTEEGTGLKLVEEAARAIGQAQLIPQRGPARLRAVLPGHARRLVERLLGLRDRFQSLNELQGEWLRTRRLPTQVTTSMRSLHLGLLSVLLGIGFFMMALCVRTAAVGRIVTQDILALRVQGLRQVLQQEHLRSRFVAALPADVAAQTEQDWPSTAARLERWLTEQRAERQLFVQRVGRLGTFAKWQIRQSFLDPDQPLLVEPMAANPTAFVLREVPRRTPMVMTLRHEDLQQLLLATDPSDADPLRGDEWWLFGNGLALVIFFPVLCIAWAFLTRGGFSWRVAGLTLVNNWGEPAGRWRSTWRVSLFWMPVVALLVTIVAVDAFFPNLAWVATILLGAYVLVLVSYAFLALRYPQRGPLDWLAGTYVMPR